MIALTFLEGGRRFPRYVNPAHVAMLAPGTPVALDIDDSPVNVPTTILWFANTSASVIVQGSFHVVAARLRGEEA